MSGTIQWPHTASVQGRIDAAVSLGRALSISGLAVEVRCQVEAALTVAAADPAPRVRAALAETIATSRDAPLQVIAQLATDRPDIAGLVLARSPIVTEQDLLDLAPRLDPRVLPVIACRTANPGLAATLVELGEPDCSEALLRNPQLALPQAVLERIAERHGHSPDVRNALLSRSDLSIAARYVLVDRLCNVLAATGLVANVLGERRGRAVLDDAQGAALVASARGRSEGELAVLVEEVSDRNGIDATMLLRALCHGERDLFAAFAARLSGLPIGRTRALLKSAKPTTLRSLLERCDLTPELAGYLARCAGIVFTQRADSGPAEMSARLAEACPPTCAETGRMAALLRRWHVEALRTGGTNYAQALSRAA